ncbi:MAG: N-glycosylase/DNA lyase [Elusimicrobia bacterium]|nr:N-glycosylase/DNA lyase [Elusimicrobiota bacterium]
MKNQLKVYERLFCNTPDIEPINSRKLRLFWMKVKNKIENRLNEFKKIWSGGSEEDIFAELVFCLFTPQSKAVSCGEAVRILSNKGLLIKGDSKNISKEINIVRFRNNKAKYLVEARNKFYLNSKLKIKEKISSFLDVFELRDWLVENIKGLGFKEASHFLRNVGFGKDFAILDRHILKNIKRLNVINSIPKTISKKTYLKIEEKMKKFAKKVEIPLDHLDLLFWSMETGEIFK